jgi:hypothetical protein
MLFEQLTRPANFYFLCIAVLQVIPIISTSGGRPTILLPLIFVLAVSGVKEALEDWVRYVRVCGRCLLCVRRWWGSFAYPPLTAITKRARDGGVHVLTLRCAVGGCE